MIARVSGKIRVSVSGSGGGGSGASGGAIARVSGRNDRRHCANTIWAVNFRFVVVLIVCEGCLLLQSSKTRRNEVEKFLRGKGSNLRCS